MTKAEMIEKIAKDAEISKAAAAKAYDSFLGRHKRWSENSVAAR